MKMTTLWRYMIVGSLVGFANAYADYHNEENVGPWLIGPGENAPFSDFSMAHRRNNPWARGAYNRGYGWSVSPDAFTGSPWGWQPHLNMPVHPAYGGVQPNWQHSGGHWASIISDTSDAGFGYAVTDSGTPFWVGVYGYPAEDEAEASESTEDVATSESTEADNNLTYYPRRRLASRRYLTSRRYR